MYFIAVIFILCSSSLHSSHSIEHHVMFPELRETKTKKSVKSERMSVRKCRSDESQILPRDNSPKVRLRADRKPKKGARKWRKGLKLLGGFLDDRNEEFVVLPAPPKERKREGNRLHLKKGRAKSLDTVMRVNRNSLFGEKIRYFSDLKDIYEKLHQLINHGQINELYEKSFNEVLGSLRHLQFLPEELRLLSILWRDNLERKISCEVSKDNFLAKVNAWFDMIKRGQGEEREIPADFEHDVARKISYYEQILKEKPEVLPANLVECYKTDCFSVADLTIEEIDYLEFLAKNFLLLFRQASLEDRMFFKKLNDCLTTSAQGTLYLPKTNEHLLNFIFLRLLQPMIMDLRLDNYKFSKKQIKNFRKKVNSSRQEQGAELSISNEMRTLALSDLKEKEGYYEAMLLKLLMSTFAIYDYLPQNNLNDALSVLKNDMVSALISDD